MMLVAHSRTSADTLQMVQKKLETGLKTMSGVVSVMLEIGSKKLDKTPQIGLREISRTFGLKKFQKRLLAHSLGNQDDLNKMEAALHLHLILLLILPSQINLYHTSL